MNGMGVTSHLLQLLDLWGVTKGVPKPHDAELIRERCFSQRARPPSGLPGGIFSPRK